MATYYKAILSHKKNLGPLEKIFLSRTFAFKWAKDNNYVVETIKAVQSNELARV